VLLSSPPAFFACAQQCAAERKTEHNLNGVADFLGQSNSQTGPERRISVPQSELGKTEWRRFRIIAEGLVQSDSDFFPAGLGERKLTIGIITLTKIQQTPSPLLCCSLPLKTDTSQYKKIIWPEIPS
jgi:hypothetical protein